MKLDKVFTEVRFEPSFLYEDARTLNYITKELKPIFPIFEHNTDRKVLAFLQPENNSKCFISSDKVVVDLDEPKDFQQFQALTTKVIPLVLKKFEVESTKRIGVRAQFHKEDIKDERNSTDLILKTFFNTNTNNFISKHLPDRLLQPRAGFVIGIGHDYFLNINIAFHIEGMITMRNGMQENREQNT